MAKERRDESHEMHSRIDHRRNEDILEELSVDRVGKELAQHKEKQLNHVSRMTTLDTQKNSLTLNLGGRRGRGRRGRRRRRRRKKKKKKTWTTIKESTRRIQS
jgi:hypothetical protein